jgi:hypothetical protein
MLKYHKSLASSIAKDIIISKLKIKNINNNINQNNSLEVTKENYIKIPVIQEKSENNNIN